MQIEHKHCAFVTFTSRQAAETAAEALSNRLIIKGNRCRLLWGKPQEKRDAAAAAALSMLPSQVTATFNARNTVPVTMHVFDVLVLSIMCKVLCMVGPCRAVPCRAVLASDQFTVAQYVVLVCILACHLAALAILCGWVSYAICVTSSRQQDHILFFFV